MLTFKQKLANRLGINLYLGEWDASSNSPSISSGVGQTNGYYVVSTAGSSLIDGESSWGLGDWIYFNGTEWKKIDNSELVEVVDSMSGTETDKAPSVSSVKTYIDDNFSVVACSVYPSSSQSITSGAVTKVLFDTLNFGDTHSAFNFTTDRYVAPVSGWYSINATVAFPVNSNGSRVVGYRINASFVRWMSGTQSPTGDFGRIGGSALVYLNTNDYVELFTYQNSGVSLAIFTGPDNTTFSIHKI